MRSLTDADRKVVAGRRQLIDEAVHEKALRAGAEALVARADVYARARAQIAGAHVPDALDDGAPDAELVEVSRLVQLAVDEGLLAVVGRLTLHPNHLRELIAPWPAD